MNEYMYFVHFHTLAFFALPSHLMLLLRTSTPGGPLLPYSPFSPEAPLGPGAPC